MTYIAFHEPSLGEKRGVEHMHVVFSEAAFKLKQEEIERHCRLRQAQGFYADDHHDESEAHGLIAWIVGKLLHGHHAGSAKVSRAS